MDDQEKVRVKRNEYVALWFGLLLGGIITLAITRVIAEMFGLSWIIVLEGVGVFWFILCFIFLLVKIKK